MFIIIFFLLYGDETEVEFGHGTSTSTWSGVAQGRASSACLFDAILGYFLQKDGLLTTYTSFLTHDDTYNLIKKREINECISKFSTTFAKMGLELNMDKIEILAPGFSEKDVINLKRSLNYEIKISTEGMVISGVAVGTDAFIQSQVSIKLSKTEADLKSMINLDPRNIGSAFSITRSILLPRHLFHLRNIPREIQKHMNVKFDYSIASSLLGVSKDALSDLGLSDSLFVPTKERLDRLHLKIRSGGAGLSSLSRLNDIALIGSWLMSGANVCRATLQDNFMECHFEETKYGIKFSPLWSRITNAANRILTCLSELPDEFTLSNMSAFQSSEVKIEIRSIMEKLILNGGRIVETYGSGIQAKLSLITDARLRLHVLTHFRDDKNTSSADTSKEDKIRFSECSGGTNNDNILLSRFITGSHPLAGRFLNILHLGYAITNASLANKAISFVKRIGVDLIPSNLVCPCCKLEMKSFYSHVESCGHPLAKVVAKRNSNAAGIDQIIKDIAKSTKYFSINDKQPHYQAHMELLPNANVKKQERSDLYIYGSSFLPFALDTTTTSTVVPTSWKFNGMMGLACAEAERKKKLIFDKYQHENGQLRAAGFDTTGGFGKEATKAFGIMFKRSTADSPNGWLSEQFRIYLKRRLIDRISSRLHAFSSDLTITMIRKIPFVERCGLGA